MEDLGLEIDAVTKKTGKELVEALEALIDKHGSEGVQEWRSPNKNKDTLVHTFARLGL